MGAFGRCTALGVAFLCVKEACMRNLEHCKPTKFKLPSSHYDKDAADRAVTFISLLKFSKLEWYGKPFELIDCQEQIV